MSGPGFSREGSADSPQASARGLLNGQPIAKQPSLLQRLRQVERGYRAYRTRLSLCKADALAGGRSGNKPKTTTSGKFNIPQDMRDVMVANSQKYPAEDPLRITISKYDKKHWHQPAPEDELAPGTPTDTQVRPNNEN